MTDASISQIQAALLQNECGGNKDLAYQPSFAGTAKSGLSFGEYQNDASANPEAFSTLRRILDAASTRIDQIGRITGVAAKPCTAESFMPNDLAVIRAAFQSVQGKYQIDSLDNQTWIQLLGYLTACKSLIQPLGRSIDSDAQIAIVLWCNMSGPPTLLKTWLMGKDVYLNGETIEAPGNLVTSDDVFRYLDQMAFFQDHPQNEVSFRNAVEVGLKAA